MTPGSKEMNAAKIANSAIDWRSYLEPAIQAGENLVAQVQLQGPQAVQEVLQQFTSGMAMGYMGLFLGDAEHPDFWPQVHQAFNFLAPNPDDTYYLAPLDGKGTYRLSGFRGTVYMVDVQIGSGPMMPYGTGTLGPNLATHDLDEIEFGSDGWFEVILSAERPPGYSGNWWVLGETASYLLIRQVAYDWMREVDGRYAIERLDRPAARPRPSGGEIESKLRSLPFWAENWTKTAMKWIESYSARGLVNKVECFDLTKVGGVASQQYIEGQFQVDSDEALIYEVVIPTQCRYWNVQLTDMLWATLDWKNRQTTLNGHTAHIDSDGKFRAVISAVDPGVANWLDNMGHERGAILGRWTECNIYPTPTITRVKLAEVRNYLPAGTPTVTAQEREDELRLRRTGAQLRRRW